MKIITVHNYGLNNIDLEGRVEENNTSQKIKHFDVEVSGFHGKRTAFELPPHMWFKVFYDKKDYYCVLDETKRGDPQKIFPNSYGGVTILGDEKYDLVGKLEPSLSHTVTQEFWQIRIIEATGGGGAHNTAFGQQIYLSEIKDPDIAIKLTVPVGSTLIQSRLPADLEYNHLYGISNEDVSMNLNFAPVNGKKITLRSQAMYPQTRVSNLGISNGDVVVLNTVRDVNYLGLLEDALRINEDVKLFLAATDSMIGSIGTKKVWELIRRSDVYVSNKDELENLYSFKGEEVNKLDETIDNLGVVNKGEMKKLVGVKINDPQTLARMMYHVQSNLITRDGSPGRVYITFGEGGSSALGQEKVIYWQPVTPGDINPFKRLTIGNTNGCGDAYLAIVVIKEILLHPTLEILNEANTAGHICATKATASGAWMATESRIKEFRDTYGKPDFHRYDQRAMDFIRTRV